MENEKFISGMVMYTIKDKNLIDAVRESIIENLEGKRLDQSCYEINCNDKTTGEIVEKIMELCEKAKKKTNEEFFKDDSNENSDFVTFYRATNSNYKNNRDKIQRIPVVGE